MATCFYLVEKEDGSFRITGGKILWHFSNQNGHKKSPVETGLCTLKVTPMKNNL
jgi:hypothetical protein